MRLAFMAVVLGVTATFAGQSRAGEFQAEPKKMTHIEAQALGSALRSFARDRGLQVLASSDLVRNLHSQSVDGELTTGEALKRLLGGTGLTYRYLDAKTVTILRAGAESPGTESKATALMNDSSTGLQVAQAVSGESPVGQEGVELGERVQPAVLLGIDQRGRRPEGYFRVMGKKQLDSCQVRSLPS